MNERFVSVEDVVEMIQVMLQESFPGADFSVSARRASGAGIVDVMWRNGPAPHQVDRCVEVYQGLSGRDHDDKPARNYQLLDGQPMKFGSDVFLCGRSLDPAIVERLGSEAAAAVGIPAPAGGRWTREAVAALSDEQKRQRYAELRRRMHEYTEFESPCPSEQLGRVVLLGNDARARSEYFARPAVSSRRRTRSPGL